MNGHPMSIMTIILSDTWWRTSDVLHGYLSNRQI